LRRFVPMCAAPASPIWIFAISRNTGGFACLRLKCGGFLDFSLVLETSISRYS
jgi:hypothetical protein